MKTIRVFMFEQTHFRRTPSKVISCLLFFIACLYSIYNGFDIQHSQEHIIDRIQTEQAEEIDNVLTWFANGEKGPKDRDWVDIHDPYWALRYTPTYTIKKPSILLPLGIGQTEQYGYYKEISFWSTTYDNDMVEEIANPERLLQGNIDFSFLIIYLLPLLLVILTYNIGGLERDKQFEKLITIQYGSIRIWLGTRFAFYVTLLLFAIVSCVVGVALINNGFYLLFAELGSLLLLAIGYTLFFAILFFFVLIRSSGSSASAFQMISIWLLLCVVIPGTVHQYASIQVPVHYMTDYLDTNRKETYATYALSSDVLLDKLRTVYPEITKTKHGKEDSKEDKIIRRSIGAIINEMNKDAVAHIEKRNEVKNKIIRSSYWYNPVSFAQNQWNTYTYSDYYSFQKYRMEVQQTIDTKIKLLVFEIWNQKTVDREIFEQYIQALK
ncbi:MAG: hypothetical protein CL916_10500 [Deltaproteobacteria bacterium]|nr:hypothetical protein [Deltaproteobacteria bacterium]